MSSETPENPHKGRARDRQRRRRGQSGGSMVRSSSLRAPGRPATPRQIAPTGGFKMPTIKVPRNPVFYLIPLGMAAMVLVIVALGLLKNDDRTTPPNALFLDKRWTYESRSETDLTTLTNRLRQHQVGTIYAYVSSLSQDNTWAGETNTRNGFVQIEQQVKTFVAQSRRAYPEVRLMAWIEVRADLDADGYRLDNEDLYQNIANFSNRAVSELGFDGVLLDVKPVWTDNDDLLALVRVVRGRIGLDTPLALAVPPDLTPENVGLQNPQQIAPNTVWSSEFKQRVALQADELVITAYQSYRDDPAQYEAWVSYQVRAYVEALAAQDFDTQLYIGIPLYERQLPAHDPAVENMQTGLNGVNQAVQLPEVVNFVYGVAIYTDRDLSDNDWALFRDRWLGP